MKKIRPGMIGLVSAILVTAVAGGLWAIGWEDPIFIVLWPGAMLGWAFVFGDNIRSFHDVPGVITLISLVTNGIAGLIIGACIGFVGSVWKHQREKKESPNQATDSNKK